jgi:hypothetical protein
MFCLLTLAAVTITGCDSASGSGNAKGAMTFTGFVNGSGLVVGGGADHICGPQSNGSYSAALRSIVEDKHVVVNIQVPSYQRPRSYTLGADGNVVTLSIEGVTTQLYGPAWQSAEGAIVVDSTQYAGSMQAKLLRISPRGQSVPSSDVTVDGHWSCSSSATG